IERKIRTLLTKHKTILPTALKRKLTRYHSKPPIISSIDSPCYALAEFPHKILNPLSGNTGSIVKNSEHFIKSIQDIYYFSVATAFQSFWIVSNKEERVSFRKAIIYA
ncbi:hypothetical protein B7P43_G13805, partial [Cryptotermes secundus]